MSKLKFIGFNKAMILLGVKMVHLSTIIYVRGRFLMHVFVFKNGRTSLPKPTICQESKEIGC